MTDNSVNSASTMPLQLPEKRFRNKSICCLYTPPPYPGYLVSRKSTARQSAVNVPFLSSKGSYDLLSSFSSTDVDSKGFADHHRRETADSADSLLLTNDRSKIPIVRIISDDSNGTFSGNKGPPSRHGVHGNSTPNTKYLYGLSSSSGASKTDNVGNLRRKNVSKASSGYGSCSSSSGSSDSDPADEDHKSAENSAQDSRMSSMDSSPDYSNNSPSSVLKDVDEDGEGTMIIDNAIYPDDILRVLESDGLTSLASGDEKAISGGNVLDMARDFQMRLVCQERQKRLETCMDDNQKRRLAKRFNELKAKLRGSSKENCIISSSSMVINSKNPNRDHGSRNDKQEADGNSQGIGGIASLSCASSVQNATSQRLTIPHNGSSTNQVARNPSDKKTALLRWCQIKTKEYAQKNVTIVNFSTSWADGMAFCALIHHFFKDAFKFDDLSPGNVAENCELAFKVAHERANIAPLLDVEDMVKMWPKPDYKCIFTYVQCMYEKLREFEQPNKQK